MLNRQRELAGILSVFPDGRYPARACSSAGQSNSLLSCGPGVRIPSGAPYGECSSAEERQIVALEVVGSSPITHPIGA